ncbi:MAG TPA: hypothetical protein ENK19_07625 [Acidobacteria bacterium]|nr:hypothetical protein [Acidobacteriota bacterium]
MAFRGLTPRQRPALWVAALFFLVHLPLLGLVELSGDESFYWLYARHLDWGYLTNPPLIGWVVAASTSILGDTVTGVRLGVLVVASLGVFALVRLGEALGGRHARCSAVTFFFLVPLSWLYGFMAAPDVLLAALVACALAATVTAWCTGRTAFWAGSGALLGLALLAKYTAVLPAAALVPLVVAGGRRWGWKAPAAWMAAGLATAGPHLVWLASNGAEPLLLRVAVHGHEEVSEAFAGHGLLHFLGTQAGVWSPVAAGVVLWALWRLLRSGTPRAPHVTAMALGTVLPFAAFLVWSPFGPVHPYWTSVALPAACGLVAVFLAGLPPARRRLLWWALGAQAVAVLVAGALILGGRPGEGYLGRRVRWAPGENRRLAARLRPLLDAAGPGALLATSRGYATVAQQAFYLGVPERTVALAPFGLAVQLDEWAAPWRGRNAVLVAPGSLDEFPLPVYFERCHPPERIAPARGRVYTAAVCEGYRGPARWLWEPAHGADPQAVAGSVYRALLGRPPDPEGLRSVAWALERGELAHLVWNIVRSPEYRTRFAGETPVATARRILAALGEPDADPARLARAVELLAFGGPHGLFLRLLDEHGGPAGLTPEVEAAPPAPPPAQEPDGASRSATAVLPAGTVTVTEARRPPGPAPSTV